MCRSTSSSISSLMFILSIVALILRSIILRLYPPPTLLGRAPSVIAKISVRRWSIIRYRPSSGVMILLTWASVRFADVTACLLTVCKSSYVSRFLAMAVKYLASIAESGSIPVFSNRWSVIGPKQQSYAVGVPFVIHANLSRPAPISIILWSSVVCCPNSPWNSVNTAFPNSSPLTKYSSDDPNDPPPAHTSSTKTISSFLIPNCSVSSLKSKSTHWSFQYPCLSAIASCPIMQKLEKCLPVTPTFSRSLKRRHVCGTTRGFAGNSKTTFEPITL